MIRAGPRIDLTTVTESGAAAARTGNTDVSVTVCYPIGVAQHNHSHAWKAGPPSLLPTAGR